MPNAKLLIQPSLKPYPLLKTERLKEKPDSRSAIITTGQQRLGSELGPQTGLQAQAEQQQPERSTDLRGMENRERGPDEVRLWHPNPVFVAGFGYCFVFSPK